MAVPITLKDELNERQYEAVTHIDGPLLILAGAGSGKTRVLTYRTAYMIGERGIDPRGILAITFTNKAAGEMRDRIQGLVGDYSRGMWIHTFHSMCARILRVEAGRLGYGTAFSIYDAQDSGSLIRRCLKGLNMDERGMEVRAIQSSISKAKDEMVGPGGYIKAFGDSHGSRNVAAVYGAYQDALEKSNAMDFDDLIMLTTRLFTDDPEALEKYASRFRYVMVDEYQDTNKAQYTLVSMLVSGHGNLCVVGDDDQSIYGWRGANIRNILDFEKEFPDAKVIKLEQNYRSTGRILEAANRVIGNNVRRKRKELWTANPTGPGVSYHVAESEHHEAAYVCGGIAVGVDGGLSYRDHAVLYRTNAQSRVIEEQMMVRGLPYKVFGGLKFYSRKEIKDMVAYLRVINNPQDDVGMRRIINVPKRGIGEVTVEGLSRAASEAGKSIFEVMARPSGYPALKASANRLFGFAALIAGLREAAAGMPISGLIRKVMELTGMAGSLAEEGTEEAQSRLENLREFVSVATEYEKANPEITLDEFLCDVSLVSDADEMGGDSDYVSLMTIHSAKGLEFPVVYMVGMDEGLFPGYRSVTSESALEEERRLCYVGITRSKERLSLTSARRRTIYGKTEGYQPSRFIGEIGGLLEGDPVSGTGAGIGSEPVAGPEAEGAEAAGLGRRVAKPLLQVIGQRLGPVAGTVRGIKVGGGPDGAGTEAFAVGDR
ncbi:MAG: UvrD-helicase domain-containing protein, partial [Oscillospiraceae bacterium]|nr:UvrD-helicase domain-containing protein [Oscillospiraceae bacterium]